MYFSEFFTQVEEFRKATFLKVWRKLAQNRDSDVGFPVFRLSLCILRRSNADIFTVWSTWYYLAVEKNIFKKFQLVRDICQFSCAPSRFFSLRAQKGMAGLCFHNNTRFASFAYRNFIFLRRFRNTVLSYRKYALQNKGNIYSKIVVESTCKKIVLNY